MDAGEKDIYFKRTDYTDILQLDNIENRISGKLGEEIVR